MLQLYRHPLFFLCLLWVGLFSFESFALPQTWLAPQSVQLQCDNQKIDYDFTPSPKQFSINNMFWMMWFSKRSFSGEKEETQKEVRALGFHNIAFIENNESGLQVLMAGNDSDIIVAYQGSKQWVDWMMNFDYEQVPGKTYELPGYLHRGFISMLQSEWRHIEQTITSFRQKEQTVWITGHSLGGALATLTAIRWANIYPLATLYTFAAPKVGDLELALYASQTGLSHYRFVNDEDIVPRLPPAGNATQQASAILPLFDLSMYAHLQEMNYSHWGEMVLYEKDQPLLFLPTFFSTQENYYWAQQSFSKVLRVHLDRTQAKRHHENTYLCLLWSIKSNP